MQRYTSRKIVFAVSSSLTSSLVTIKVKDVPNETEQREWDARSRAFTRVIFSAALDLEDFIGIEEQQDLGMIMALEEIRKGTCEGGCGQDTRRSRRSGSSQ